MFDLQKTDKPAKNPQHNALHQPSGPYAERGRYEGHVAESSLYTKASLHPLIAGGLLLAGAGLAYVAFREAPSEKEGATDTTIRINNWRKGQFNGRRYETNGLGLDGYRTAPGRVSAN